MCNTQIKKIQLEHEERGTLQISFDAVDETRRRERTGTSSFFFRQDDRSIHDAKACSHQVEISRSAVLLSRRVRVRVHRRFPFISRTRVPENGPRGRGLGD